MGKNKEKDTAIVLKPSSIEKVDEQKFSAEALLSQAVEKNVPVETMEKLLAMRRELKEEWAKEQFDVAMAKFQSECPVIEKTKKVMDKNGKTVRYKYAPIESIVEQSKEFIAKNDLSYSLNVEQDEKMLTVICKVKHKAGHCEKSKFSVPIGNESYMSDVQKYGARCTFAKRYVFCNAFGILTGDEDTDATQETVGSRTEKNNNKTPEKEPEKPNLKSQIANMCKKLDKSLKTKEDYEKFVMEKTTLPLIEKNYPTIISVLKGEKKKEEKEEEVDPITAFAPPEKENESLAAKKMREGLNKK